MTTLSIRTELAGALRAVAAEYNKLPESARPNVSWSTVDDVLEEALHLDRQEALAAIEDWKQHHLKLFEEASR